MRVGELGVHTPANGPISHLSCPLWHGSLRHVHPTPPHPSTLSLCGCVPTLLVAPAVPSGSGRQTVMPGKARNSTLCSAWAFQRYHCAPGGAPPPVSFHAVTIRTLPCCAAYACAVPFAVLCSACGTPAPRSAWRTSTAGPASTRSGWTMRSTSRQPSVRA